jgi:hypothetical protein
VLAIQGAAKLLCGMLKGPVKTPMMFSLRVLLVELQGRFDYSKRARLAPWLRQRRRGI